MLVRMDVKRDGFLRAVAFSQSRTLHEDQCERPEKFKDGI